MIARTFRLLLPAFKTIPKTYSPTPSLPYFNTFHRPKYMFSQQKNKEPDNNKEEIKGKEEESGKKLTDLTNEQLIELNTDESLRIVEKNIDRMKKSNDEMNKKIKESQNQLQYFERYHEGLADKEEKLLENIKQLDADLVRIKKRMEKEIQDSKDYAITKLVSELLQFSDSMKRCSKEASQLINSHPNDQYFIKIVQSYKVWTQFLKLYDIQEFDPINEPFDPNTSESLLTIPCPPGYTVNNVATTMRTGYRIKDRLLRSARVGIFV